MGTRGFVGFLTPERELRGSYNHFDSYPTQLGKALQDQLAKLFRTEDWSWDQVREKAAAIRWVNAQKDPTNEDRERYKHLWQQVSTGDDWYSLLRGAQGNLVFMLKNGIATADHDFPRDSLFCEWGYLLDLYTDEVVVLRGFNTDEAKQAEYCQALKEDVQTQIDRNRKHSDSRIYYGCTEIWRGTVDAFLELDMKNLEDSVYEADEAESATGS